MTTNGSFGLELSQWLHEEGEHRVPDHLAEVLVKTVATPQRRWWSSPERWLPMQSTLRFAPVPRIAWGLALLALVLALGAAVVLVGSRSRHAAPPFGLARNGEIAYGLSDGDIYAYDPVTGKSRSILTGPEQDAWPWFSRDGTTLKIERATGVPNEVAIVLADADGSHARTIVSAIVNATSMDWSADGTRLAIVGDIAGVHGAYLFDVSKPDQPTTLHLPLPVDSMEYRPSGDLVVTAKDGATFGLYEMHPDGTGWRTIATSAVEFTSEQLSPDGMKVVYTTWNADAAQQAVMHVIDVETGDISTPVFDGRTTADEGPMWSPDSTRLVFERYYGNFRVAVAPVTGGHVVETGPTHATGSGGVDKQFSPDGTQIFAIYASDGSTWLLDPAGGPGTQLSVTLQTGGSWQRMAP